MIRSDSPLALAIDSVAMVIMWMTMLLIPVQIAMP